MLIQEEKDRLTLTIANLTYYDRERDWDIILLLADLYEEEGRDDMSLILRWMRREKLRPMKLMYQTRWYFFLSQYTDSPSSIHRYNREILGVEEHEEMILSDSFDDLVIRLLPLARSGGLK